MKKKLQPLFECPFLCILEPVCRVYRVKRPSRLLDRIRKLLLTVVSAVHSSSPSSPAIVPPTPCVRSSKQGAKHHYNSEKDINLGQTHGSSLSLSTSCFQQARKASSFPSFLPRPTKCANYKAVALQPFAHRARWRVRRESRKDADEAETGDSASHSGAYSSWHDGVSSEPVRPITAERRSRAENRRPMRLGHSRASRDAVPGGATRLGGADRLRHRARHLSDLSDAGR